MIFQIIIGISAVFALLWLVKIQNKVCRWITLAAAVTTGISLIPYPIPSRDGFVAYLIVQAVFLFYVFSPNDYDNKKKIYITTIVLIPATYMCLELTEYRGNILAGFLCIISILAFLNLIFKERRLFIDELGILAIIFTHAIVRLTINIIELSRPL